MDCRVNIKPGNDAIASALQLRPRFLLFGKRVLSAAEPRERAYTTMNAWLDQHLLDRTAAS